MSLLSGGRYLQLVVTFGGSLLSVGRYFRWVVTFGGSLLSAGRYFQGTKIKIVFKESWRELFLRNEKLTT